MPTTFRLHMPVLAMAVAVAIRQFVEPSAGWLDPMHVVKLFTVAGATALALAFHRLLEALGADRRRARTAALLTLPLVASNALLLDGAHAVQTAACVIAVAMAIERRHAAMFAWWGIAIAFAASALLLAPFFVALAIQRRIAYRWLVAPATALPAMLVIGFPDFITDTTSAPNIWSLLAAIAPEHAPALLGLVLATALGIAAAYVARMQSIAADRAALVGLAALALLLAALLLPHIQLQDFVLAAILTLAVAIARGTGRAVTLAALVQLGMAAAFADGLGSGIPLAAIGALGMIAATWIAARPLIAPHANDNRDGPHAIPLPHGLRGTLSFDMMARPAVWPRGE